MSRQILANPQSATPNRFSVFIVQKNSDQEKFEATAETGLKIRATETVADILSNITYFIDEKNDIFEGVMNIPLYTEFSRWKPSGILFERIVDIDFLLKMQKNRKDVTSFNLKNERFYLKAVVVETTQEPEKNLYEACPNDCCYGAKVVPMCLNGEFLFYCPKCRTKSLDCDLRLMPKVDLIEPSESTNSAAETLTVAVFKKNAEMLLEEKEENIPEILQKGQIYFGEIFNMANGQEVVLRLRASIFRGTISFSVDELF